MEKQIYNKLKKDAGRSDDLLSRISSSRHQGTYCLNKWPDFTKV